MKKIIFVLIVVFCVQIINAQELKSGAIYIKKNYPAEYEATLKKHVLEEWNDDYRMVVYEINKQAESLVELIGEFKSENTNVVFKAIQEWSIGGYKSSNIDKFREIDTFGLKQLLQLHCDWRMVKYEYDKQVKAKNAF
jgi:hypothetical protein